MLTFLDLLIVVFMVLAAASLLALCLMFLVRNPKVQKVCLFITAALGSYTAYIGIRIGGLFFPVQAFIGIAVGLASITAVVLALLARDSRKKFLIARILAAAALVIGIANAFM